MIHIGTAAWGLPRAVADSFGPGASNLQRYATRLSAVEINSTFYRPHRPATFARWAASVPDGFRFAVKVPQAITHEARLVGCETAVSDFLGQIAGLGDRTGPLLVQLPPSLALAPAVADRFFAVLRSRWAGTVACEPRHATWFTAEAEALLLAWRIARVAADPAPVPAAARPAGWPGLVYHRLHGSPQIYWSDYEAVAMERIAAAVGATADVETWCVFDNTAAGAATANALDLRRRLGV